MPHERRAAGTTRGNTRTCRTRNGPHQRRTRDRFRPERHRVVASIQCREKLLGFRCARPSFFGRHRDRPNPEILQPHVLEKLPNLSRTPAQPGQLKDAFTGLGYGADGLLLERLADQFAVAGHLADRGRYLRQVATAYVDDILSDPDMAVCPQSQQTFLDGYALYKARPDKGYSLTDCVSMQAME